VSYYGDLHTGALVLMRAAKKAGGRRQQELMASSMTLELYALHFLQDSVSAGHLGGEAVHHLGYPSVFLRHDSDRVASAGSLLDAPKRKTLHDKGNVDGRRVILSLEAGRALCDVGPQKKRSSKEILAAAKMHTLFGDGAMLCGSKEDQPWMTRELVKAVTKASLLELESAYADKLTDHVAPKVLNKPEVFFAKTPCNLPTPPPERRSIHRIHGLTCQWWESNPDNIDEKALAIRRAVAAGYFKAVGLLPLPTHDDGMFARTPADSTEGINRKSFCDGRGYD